jgi:hypothetical protein
MSRILDLAGVRFGRLTAIERQIDGPKNVKWRCICDCGAEKWIRLSHLRSGATQSCGCLAVETSAALNTKHGMYGTRTYRIWMLMHQRCSNPKSTPYPFYGALGVSVCDAWSDFAQFLADMGECPSSVHSLDRFPNTEGNYEPSNCRWATKIQQARNTKSNHWIEFKGERKTLAEWSELLDIPYTRIKARLAAGYPPEVAFLPVKAHRSKPLETFK